MDTFSFDLPTPIYILIKEWKVETLTGLTGTTIFIFSFAVLCECFKGILRYYDSVCKVDDTDEAKQRYICLFVKTSYHLLNIIGGYLLMLIVMTYNAWLLVAVVMGTGFAYFITGPLILMYIGEYQENQFREVTSSSDSFTYFPSPNGSAVATASGKTTELPEISSL